MGEMTRTMMVSAGLGALVLSGCGSADPVIDAPAVAAIQVEGLDAKAIAAHFGGKVTTVRAADVETALRRMKLWEAGKASWAAREITDTGVVFTDFAMMPGEESEDAKAFSADRVELGGLRPMTWAGTGEDALEGVAFDRAVVSGMRADVVALDSLVVVDATLPTEAFEPDMLDLSNGIPFGVGAFAASGLLVEDDEATLRLASLAFADSEADQRNGFFALRGMALDVEGSKGLQDTDSDIVEPLDLDQLNGEIEPAERARRDPDAPEDIEGTDADDANDDNDIYDADDIDDAYRDTYFVIEQPPVELALDEISIVGVAPLGPFVQTLVSSMAPAIDASAQDLRDRPSMTAEQKKTIREQMRTLMLEPYREFDMKGLRFASEGVAIGLDALEYEYDANARRIAAETELSGLVVDLSGLRESQDADAREAFTALDAIGYSRLVMRGEGTANVNRKTDVANAQGIFEVVDGMTLRYDYDYEGAIAMVEAYADMMTDVIASGGNEAALGSAGFALFGMMDAYRISGLNLSIRDEGLVEGLVTLAVESEGLTREEARAEMATEIEAAKADAASVPVDAAIIGDSLDAVEAFLFTPGSTLTIRLKPEKPLTLMGMMGMSAERMGFSAETK